MHYRIRWYMLMTLISIVHEVLTLLPVFPRHFRRLLPVCSC